MFRNLTDLVFDKRFKITIMDGIIDINNYEDILIFDDDKVLIKTKDKTIKVIGSSLIITRLLNKEVLIEGKIKSIELE